MADPTIQTFWWEQKNSFVFSAKLISPIFVYSCHHRNANNSAYYLMNEFNKESFLIISIVASIIGISGSIYQIFIRKNELEATTPRSLIGRKIIIYLACSDLFASIGILVRSGTWSFLKQMMPYDDDSVSVLFCSITSVSLVIFLSVFLYTDNNYWIIWYECIN